MTPSSTATPSGCTPPSGFQAVRTEAEFRTVANPAGNYFLCNDIVLSAPLEPLFNSQGFSGVLDGNGREIRGLVMNGAQHPSYGMVRILQGGTVRNLRFVNPSVHGRGVTGVVAGIASGTIQNVTIEGGQVQSQYQPAGAIAGVNFGGSISSCSSTAFVTAAGNTGDQLVGLGFP